MIYRCFLEHCAAVGTPSRFIIKLAGHHPAIALSSKLDPTTTVNMRHRLE